jgi:hypothetical protein
MSSFLLYPLVPLLLALVVTTGKRCDERVPKLGV